MPEPTYILVDRINDIAEWHFRGAFYTFPDACLTAARLHRLFDGAPVEYQVLRWEDWTVADYGMTRPRPAA